MAFLNDKTVKNVLMRKFFIALGADVASNNFGRKKGAIKRLQGSLFCMLAAIKCSARRTSSVGRRVKSSKNDEIRLQAFSDLMDSVKALINRFVYSAVKT